VVIAPHVYGPDVTFNHRNHAGGSHWNRLTNSVGYFTKAGYCKNGAQRAQRAGAGCPAPCRALLQLSCSCRGAALAADPPVRLLTATCPAPAGDCQRMPVAIGEFGSRFREQGGTETMNSLVSWMNLADGSDDGQHNRITNWFYWSYNANSGDTGGLVDDAWRDLEWGKLKYLMGLGLRPWYMS
jgi:hypothetical protein